MIAVTCFFSTGLILAMHSGEILSAANPGEGEPMKYGEHESIYFRDTIAYSIGRARHPSSRLAARHQCLGLERDLHPDLGAALDAGLALLVQLVPVNADLVLSRFSTDAFRTLRTIVSSPTAEDVRMARFHTLYNAIELRGPTEYGLPDPKKIQPRLTGHSKLFGRIGEMQVGPIYLGVEGIVSLVCGFIAIEIIGLNMWASVDWNVLRFIKLLPFLSLEPPPAKYGLSFPPLHEGGWWLMAGFFLTMAIFAWWVRMYRRARATGLGTHIPWSFASAIWLYLVLGFIRPLLMGSWSEAVPFGIIPHLNWTATFSVRYGNLFYNPSTCSRLPSSTDRRSYSACTAARSSPSPSSAATARRTRSPTAARGAERAALFWRWTMGFNATFESIHRWGWWFATLTTLTGGIGILITGTVVDNWYLWGVKHGIAPDYPSVYRQLPPVPPGAVDAMKPYIVVPR